MSNARNAAVALYTLALASAATADWQAVATSLFEALPKGKAAAPGAPPAWWADYALPRHYTLESMDVVFADGATTRVKVATGKGKAPCIAPACRAAIGFYRARHGQAAAVPAFASLRTHGGQEFDAAECSRLTDTLRAIPGTVQGRPMTDARIAWMESEIARRKAGLQTALYQRNLPSNERASTADPKAWIAAVRAGEKELRIMREAYAVQRGEVAPSAVAVPEMPHNPNASELEVEQCTHNRAVTHLDVEAVLEAMGAAYGECAELELPGTFEAGTGPGRDVVVKGDPEAVSALCEVLVATAGEDVALDTWTPSIETHPVIAYCLSEKAWNALRDRVQDGTFPAPAGAARFGAWRLTLADAQDLQDVGSIRFAGMPRKPYTRRAVAPVSSFVRIHAGAAFMAATPPSPVTLHAASV